MKLESIPTALGGCIELQPAVFRDERGLFVKTFERATFNQLGLPEVFEEFCYSVSTRGVLRGLHVQLAPRENGKLVTCVAGNVVDAVLDLRASSPTYGKHVLIELDSAKANMVYIPAGMAHGFYTCSESATMLYAITSTHSPEHDAGIRWDSAGIPWPDAAPVVSARDTGLVRFADFETPFR